MTVGSDVFVLPSGFILPLASINFEQPRTWSRNGAWLLLTLDDGKGPFLHALSREDGLWLEARLAEPVIPTP